MERREFLRSVSSGIILLAAAPFMSGRQAGRTVRFGIIADAHYADIDNKGTRFYRDSIQKMREAVECFNRSDLDFIIELGDIKDMAVGKDPEGTISYLRKIEKEFRRFRGPVYHVLGNHDMDCLSKEEFLMHTRNHGKADGKAHYAFTSKGIRFIVLDANFNEDMSPYCRGNFNWKSAWIPQEQLDWLKDELSRNIDRPAVVFTHQLLDSFSKISKNVCIGNAGQVREILEAHPQVLAVFQGHHHPGHYSTREGIRYYTMKGMIENSWPEHNSYATVEIRPDGSIMIEGYKDINTINI